jgi:heat shock protein HslJ
MKKSNIIIAMLGLGAVILFAYITMDNYYKKPKSSQPTPANDPISSNEAAVNDLVGPSWSWEKIVISEDEIVFPRVHDAFSIVFTQDGAVNGTTDCNGFSSAYTKNGNNINFGLFASNQMYCENSQEEVFKRSLAQVEEFLFDENGRLVLRSGSSSMVFVDKGSEQNKKNWDLIKQAVADCNAEEVGQTHDRKVRVTLKNGDKIEAYSPKIDNIFDIVNDAQESCGKVILWTE